LTSQVRPEVEASSKLETDQINDRFTLATTAGSCPGNHDLVLARRDAIAGVCFAEDVDSARFDFAGRSTLVSD